jgi:hypothetical protein
MIDSYKQSYLDMIKLQTMDTVTLLNEYYEIV